MIHYVLVLKIRKYTLLGRTIVIKTKKTKHYYNVYAMYKYHSFYIPVFFILGLKKDLSLAKEALY